MIKSCKSKKENKREKTDFVLLELYSYTLKIQKRILDCKVIKLIPSTCLKNGKTFFLFALNKPFIYLAALTGNGEYRAAAFSYSTTWL